MSIEQLWMMNENGIRTGCYVARKTAHAFGIPHAGVSLSVVSLIDTVPKLLAQERLYNARVFGGTWDTTVTGHVQFGESSINTIRREALEEINLALPAKLKKGVFEFAGGYKSFLDIPPKFKENMFYHHFVYFENINEDTLKLQREEVSRTSYVTFQNMEKLIEKKYAHPRVEWLSLTKKCVIGKIQNDLMSNV